jgi:hypothetical protein
VAWEEFVLKELHTGYVEIYNFMPFHMSKVMTPTVKSLAHSEFLIVTY